MCRLPELCRVLKLHNYDVKCDLSPSCVHVHLAVLLGLLPTLFHVRSLTAQDQLC